MPRKRKTAPAEPAEEYSSVSSRIRQIHNGWIHSRSSYDGNGASREIETYHRKKPKAHDRIKAMMKSVKAC